MTSPGHRGGQGILHDTRGLKEMSESGKAQVGHAKSHRTASKALALWPTLEPNRTPGVVRLLGLLTAGNNAASISKT